jgi:hypothetical protein
MRFDLAPRLAAAVLVAAFLAACGGNTSTGTSFTPAGTSNLQSSARTTDTIHFPPTPTPGPCYCPPRQVCLDIACDSASAQRSADSVKPSAATPSPTPYPPCYCPPNPRPHVCPDCAVTSRSIPGFSATDPRLAMTLLRRRSIAA